MKQFKKSIDRVDNSHVGMSHTDIVMIINTILEELKNDAKICLPV